MKIASIFLLFLVGCTTKPNHPKLLYDRLNTLYFATDECVKPAQVYVQTDEGLIFWADKVSKDVVIIKE